LRREFKASVPHTQRGAKTSKFPHRDYVRKLNLKLGDKTDIVVLLQGPHDRSYRATCTVFIKRGSRDKEEGKKTVGLNRGAIRICFIASWAWGIPQVTGALKKWERIIIENRRNDIFWQIKHSSFKWYFDGQILNGKRNLRGTIVRGIQVRGGRNTGARMFAKTSVEG